ncbi:MAG: oligosaccharide flippase family protein [Planctomycetia bacterium]|nr:oligosaccharide flippase family protein [Planctomycetia bacterium]
MSGSLKSGSSTKSIRADSLAEGVLILLALTIVQRLVGFARGILFCRSLDVDQLGEWDLAFSFLMLAAPLAVFGLPGSFGRYVEAYRASGQLRTFLRRTTLCSFVPALVFCLAAAGGRTFIAELIFGDAADAPLVLAMSGTLATLIVFNFITCFFTALRASRIVSYLQFSNTILFAAVSLVLMTAWRSEAIAAVIGFGVACAVSSLVSIVWMVRLWRELPLAETLLPHRTLWTRLMPFAFWVWMTNWISNSSELADRYMIVHFSGLDSHAALDLVGQYHSARIIPVLFLGLADLLSTLITPHLIHDWEAGRREIVAGRLRLILKLFTVSFLLLSIGLVVMSPLFFQTALGDKFGFGEAVFPWALTCALWTGLAMISNNWLWCAEKSRLACVGLTLGLLTNVGLNLVLLPRYGLEGAVMASATAKFASLATLWLLCRALGMKLDRGMVFAIALPGLLLLGPWPALGAVAVLASGLVPKLGLFSSEEKRQLLAGAASLAVRFKLRAPKVAAGGTH